jgi:hypothetical protein
MLAGDGPRLLPAWAHGCQSSHPAPWVRGAWPPHRGAGALAFRDEVVATLEGEADLSPQRKNLVDLAVRAAEYLDHIDAFPAAQESVQPPHPPALPSCPSSFNARPSPTTSSGSWPSSASSASSSTESTRLWRRTTSRQAARRPAARTRPRARSEGSRMSRPAEQSRAGGERCADRGVSPRGLTTTSTESGCLGNDQVKESGGGGIVQPKPAVPQREVHRIAAGNDAKTDPERKWSRWGEPQAGER